MIYPLALLAHRDVGNAREAHGIIRSTRMRMFGSLHSTLDPGEGTIHSLHYICMDVYAV